MPSAPRLPEVRQVTSGATLTLCRCGRSPELPDCTLQCPQALNYQANRQQTLLLCRCGRSKQLPFCDGSHNRPVSGWRARWRRFFFGL